MVVVVVVMVEGIWLSIITGIGPRQNAGYKTLKVKSL